MRPNCATHAPASISWPHAPPKKLAEPFKHVSAKESPFSEARPDNHSVDRGWDRRPVSGQVVVCLIDRVHARFDASLVNVIPRPEQNCGY